VSAARAAAVALGGVLLTLCGLAFDTSALLVPGVAFTAVGALTPAAVWVVARGAGAVRLPGEPEVTEGEPFRSLVVIRSGPLGLYAELRDPLGGDPYPITMGPSLNGRTLRVEVTASFARRGRKQLPAPELRTVDPLGLAPATVAGGEGQELLVLPRIEPVRWREHGGSGRRLAHDRGTLADALTASEVDGLRPYRPGTPASRIHWPALARGAGLLERRMRAEHESRPLVVLDSRCAEEPERLDRAVRAAASLVVELARRGGCGLLCGDAGRPLEIDARLGGWPAALRRLALVAATQRPPALAARRRPGPLVYVAGELAGRLPAILQETGGVLVLPAEVTPPARWPVGLEVAGCLGYLVGGRGRRDGVGEQTGELAGAPS